MSLTGATVSCEANSPVRIESLQSPLVSRTGSRSGGSEPSGVSPARYVGAVKRRVEHPLHFPLPFPSGKCMTKAHWHQDRTCVHATGPFHHKTVHVISDVTTSCPFLNCHCSETICLQCHKDIRNHNKTLKGLRYVKNTSS